MFAQVFQPPKDGFERVFKFNPYHGHHGWFSTYDQARFISTGGKFSATNSADKAIHEAKNRLPTVDDHLAAIQRLQAAGFKITGSGTLRDHAEKWAKLELKVTPEEVVHGLLGKGPFSAGVLDVVADGTHRQILVKVGTGSLVHGARVENCTRTFNLDTKTVSHDYLSIMQSDRGGTAVKDMFKSSVPLYRKMGMERITTHANLDAGCYAWGRYGFHADDPQKYQSRAESAVDFQATQIKDALWANGKPPLSENAMKELNAMRELFKASDYNDPSLPVKLTSIRTPHLNQAMEDANISPRKGASFLQAAQAWKDWYAHLNLNDKEQVSHLSHYVGGKL